MNEASLEQLETSLRGHESLSEVEDFNGLTKKFIEHGETIKSLKGEVEGKVAIPGEDTSDEDRQTFRTTINKYLGVPETVEGYEVKKPEDTPENMAYDETLTDRMITALHKAHAPKELVHDLFKEFNDYNRELHQDYEKFVKEKGEKDLDSLKDFWKGDFEKKNSETFDALNKIAEKVKIPDSMGGMKGFTEDIENLGLKNNPRFNVFFNSFVDLVGIDEIIKGSKGLNIEDPSKPKVFSSYKGM